MFFALETPSMFTCTGDAFSGTVCWGLGTGGVQAACATERTSEQCLYTRVALVYWAHVPAHTM